jgi:hypothetical protein
LQQRRCRRSRLEHSLEQQITSITHHCGALAVKSPRLADLWKQTQDELRALTADNPPATNPQESAPPVPGAAPLPGAPGAAHSRGVCSPGARGNGTNAKGAG